MRSLKKTFAKASAFAALLMVSAGAGGRVPLLTNFDFETVDAASVWKEMSSRERPSSVSKLDTADPHSGSSALMFQTTAAGGGSRFVFTGVPLPEKHTGRIRVRFYARTDKLLEGDAEINALGRDRNQTYGWCGGEQALVKIQPSRDWQEYVAEVPVEDRVRMITLMLRINNPEAGKTLWVDDLSIEFIEPSGTQG